MEKVLIATIRGMRSLRPCPRCLVPKAEFANLGLTEYQRQRLELKRIDNNARNKLVADARLIVYTDGRAVNSKGVELLLKLWSYAPTQNAFSHRLRLLGFDIFESLTVDLLHEYELGVWKSVFQHIICILHSLGSKSVSKFNARFRLMPTFGDGTIRPFSEDVSDMTRPAARNYEDILQCIIPAIEGLLSPAYEQQALTLLFVMAQWHALAKLWKHTSSSVDALEHTTTRLGHELRQFRDCTSSLEIYETPREVASRQRRTRKRARPRAALALDKDCFDEVDATTAVRKRKYFSLETSKVHALGDYPEAVKTRGTTDSFSTQTGELLHQGTKQRYTRTNGRNYLPQMSEIERIEARLNDIGDELQKHEQGPKTNSETALIAEDRPTMDSGRSPYQMAVSQKNQSFVLRLKSHLLARLSGKNYQDESACSADELAQISFHFDRIYAHQTLKIHYTTYDVCRAQDIVNPHTPKRFVLVPSNEEADSGSGAHRFWYAKVLGIYHANVCYRGLAPKRMDFLWVRWLGRALDAPGGWDTCRLDRVAYFPDVDQTHAFDFVDPVDVIRAAHLIPRFLDDRTTQFLGGIPSIATDDKELGDWKSYYVNRFVDRDMLMRFTGMAIGHVSQRSTAGYKSGVPVATVNSGYEYLASTEQESNERPAEAKSTDPNGAEGSDIEDEYDHADGEGDSGDDGDSDESDDGSGDEHM